MDLIPNPLHSSPSRSLSTLLWLLLGLPAPYRTPWQYASHLVTRHLHLYYEHRKLCEVADFAYNTDLCINHLFYGSHLLLVTIVAYFAGVCWRSWPLFAYGLAYNLAYLAKTPPASKPKVHLKMPAFAYLSKLRRDSIGAARKREWLTTFVVHHRNHVWGCSATIYRRYRLFLWCPL